MALLAAGALAAGYRLQHVAEIGSTSAVLLERAREGEAGPAWLLADLQTSGRGRNTRQWTSPAGNLYASLLLTDPSAPEHIAELSFVLALALRDAVLAAAHLHEDANLKLKWPNDLMIEGGKAAGLLLEGGQAGGRLFVVAGFGVNIVSHPDATAHRATHLLAGGYVVERDSFMTALSATVAARIASWDRGRGFATIRRDWLAVAFGRGETLRINTLAESFDGVFETVDDAGRLLVDTALGRRVISAGEVFVLGAGP